LAGGTAARTTPGSEDAAAVYSRAGLGHSLQRGQRPAVLVVDLTRGFTDPACTLGFDLTSVVRATRRLLDVARPTAIPVVFTAIAFDGENDAGIWMQKMGALRELQAGSRWCELDPRLERRESEPLVVKRGASGFFGTNLGAILVAKNIDTVILCGATTSGCIRATAVDLLQHGWPTLVPRECVGDRARAPHEANLFDIDAKYADVVSLDDAITYLRDDVIVHSTGTVFVG
jgi:maleamate amidohydrolase